MCGAWVGSPQSQPDTPAPPFTLFLESRACCLGWQFSTEGLGGRKENALPELLHVLLCHSVLPLALVWKDYSRLPVCSWELMKGGHAWNAISKASWLWEVFWNLNSQFSLLRTAHPTHTQNIFHQLRLEHLWGLPAFWEVNLTAPCDQIHLGVPAPKRLQDLKGTLLVWALDRGPGCDVIASSA